MVKSSKGLRTGTRRKLSRKYREKFKVTPYLREFKKDQRVTVMPDPSSNRGLPHFRFKGAAGIITGRRGSAYSVQIRIGNKAKTIITGPEHLVPEKAGVI